MSNEDDENNPNPPTEQLGPFGKLAKKIGDGISSFKNSTTGKRASTAVNVIFPVVGAGRVLYGDAGSLGSWMKRQLDVSKPTTLFGKTLSEEEPSRPVYDPNDNKILGGMYFINRAANPFGLMDAKHGRGLHSVADMMRSKFVREQLQNKKLFTGVFTRDNKGDFLDPLKSQVTKNIDVFNNFKGGEGENPPTLSEIDNNEARDFLNDLNNIKFQTTLSDPNDKSYKEHMNRLCRDIDESAKHLEEAIADTNNSFSQIMAAMSSDETEHLAQLEKIHTNYLTKVHQQFDNRSDNDFQIMYPNRDRQEVRDQLTNNVQAGLDLATENVKDAYKKKREAASQGLQSRVSRAYIMSLQRPEILDPVRDKIKAKRLDEQRSGNVHFNTSQRPDNDMPQLEDLTKFQTKNGNVITRGGKNDFDLTFKSSATPEEMRSDINDVLLAAEALGYKGLSWTTSGENEKQKQTIRRQQWITSVIHYKAKHPEDQALTKFDNYYDFDGKTYESHCSHSEYLEDLKELEKAEIDYAKSKAPEDYNINNPSDEMKLLNKDFKEKHRDIVEKSLANQPDESHEHDENYNP